jgi:uncharacterized repeat protein (TIGR04138 family)
MLCEKCLKQEAVLHSTMVIGGLVRKTDLCADCALEQPEIPMEWYPKLTDVWELVTNPQGRPIPPAIQALLGKRRYPPAAYLFVCEALEYCAQLRVEREEVNITHHVSGQELSQAIRLLALKKFGMRSKALLNEWNIHRTEDFGEIVYDLIEAHLMSKTPEDSKADFANVYSFDEAFPEA